MNESFVGSVRFPWLIEAITELSALAKENKNEMLPEVIDFLKDIKDGIQKDLED